jgi:hypothetical protein
LYNIGRRPDDCTAAIQVERSGAGSQATFDIVDTVSSVASTIAPLQDRLQIPVMSMLVLYGCGGHLCFMVSVEAQSE